MAKIPRKQEIKHYMEMLTEKEIRLFSCDFLDYVSEIVPDEMIKNYIIVCRKYAFGLASDLELSETRKKAYYAYRLALFGKKINGNKYTDWNSVWLVYREVARYISYPKEVLYSHIKPADIFWKISRLKQYINGEVNLEEMKASLM